MFRKSLFTLTFLTVFAAIPAFAQIDCKRGTFVGTYTRPVPQINVHLYTQNLEKLVDDKYVGEGKQVTLPSGGGQPFGLGNRFSQSDESRAWIAARALVRTGAVCLNALTRSVRDGPGLAMTA